MKRYTSRASLAITRRTFLAAAAAAAGTSSLKAAEKSAPFQPRLAICNETFQDWPMEKAFGVAARCGYQGLEIAPFTFAEDVRTISAARRREIRRTAEKAGLEVIGLHWLLAKTKGFHLTSPDAAVRRNTAAYLADLARFSSDLGGKILVFGSPKQRDLLPGVDRAAAMGYADEVLRALLPTLEGTGTVVALEPLSPKTTTFLSTAAEAMELVRRVGDPRVALHLDCLAMSTEAAPHVDIIRRHRGQFIHFHANDPNGQGPGFGKLDFHPILAALREVGYRGWISVEVFNYQPGPERLARQSIDYLKQCLREIQG